MHLLLPGKPRAHVRNVLILCNRGEWVRRKAQKGQEALLTGRRFFSRQLGHEMKDHILHWNYIKNAKISKGKWKGEEFMTLASRTTSLVTRTLSSRPWTYVFSKTLFSQKNILKLEAGLAESTGTKIASRSTDSFGGQDAWTSCECSNMRQLTWKSINMCLENIRESVAHIRVNQGREYHERAPLPVLAAAHWITWKAFW